MKAKTLSILLIAFMTFSWCRAQQFDHLESVIDSLISNRTLPSLGVGILKDGKVIYEKSFGYADMEANVKSTVRTPYQLASLSKPITATAIMQLHKKGLLNLNDPITKYVSLQKIDPAFQDPTILQLLNHTSGLGTYFDLYYADEPIKPTSFETAWAQYGMQFHEPGKVCEYSNLGYGLLDHIISKVTSQSFDEFLQTKLFRKLNMDQSFVIEQDPNPNYALAKKYDINLEDLPPIWNNTRGAGNIASSVHDMLQFAAFNLDFDHSEVLGKSEVQYMHTYKEPDALFHYYQETHYGLGWYINEDDNGQKVVWHEGGMMGASTMLKLFPKERLALVFMTNTYNSEVMRSLTDMTAKLLINNYQPTPINETAEYASISTDSTFLGSWQGSMILDKEKVPVSLKMEDSQIVIQYLDDSYRSFLTDDQPIPFESKLLFGAVNQGYFIGTGIGELSTSDKRKECRHLLSFKLYKDGDSLKGTIINMAAAHREYYARPYFMTLKKVPGN